MNYWLIPTLVLGFALYWLGGVMGRRSGGAGFYAVLGLGLLAAIPGMVFVAYYFKIWTEPIWLYEFRSVPGSELTAAGAGFLAGLLHGRFSQWERFRKAAGNRLFAIVLLAGLTGPYLKTLLAPPAWYLFQDRWDGEVCLQSSKSSCGPACAATLLRQLGRPAQERQIAQEAHTSGQGTEIWYLARTLRRHGAQVEFVWQPDPGRPWPYPSIAGVRLGHTGHFITLLGREGDQYIIGDPLGGRHVESQAAWSRAYQFTGFFLVVR
jgi:hypothetical protein